MKNAKRGDDSVLQAVSRAADVIRSAALVDIELARLAEKRSPGRCDDALCFPRLMILFKDQACILRYKDNQTYV